MIDANLNTIEDLEALPVKIAYVGDVIKEDNWTDDQWRVTVTSDKGFHSFDYFTGTGHRTRIYRASGRHYDRAKKVFYDEKVKKPKIANVLHCLINDASAADENFHDWCSNFGYSNDSLKALDIYKDCLNTAGALRRHFTRETLAQIRELLQDY